MKVQLSRRNFLIHAGAFSGGTMFFTLIGCSSGATNRVSTVTEPKKGEDDSKLGLVTKKIQMDIESILRNNQVREIDVPAGEYRIDAAKGSLVSTMEARKLNGIGPGEVVIIFENVPDNHVCLDFRNKSRIRNITFKIVPQNPNPRNITAIRFKRVAAFDAVLVGSIEVKDTLIDVNTYLNELGIRIDSSRNAFSLNGVDWKHIGDSADDGRPIKYMLMLVPAEPLSGDRPSCFGFTQDSSGQLVFVKEDFGDEADMDSSFTSCKFIGVLSDNNSNAKREITAVEYVGRNMTCKSNQFQTIGTAVKLSFPKSRKLSDPRSELILNQGGFYGHRKGRFYLNTMNQVSRALHVAGDVTVRSLIVTENEISGGQLLFCDGEGGVRSSLFAKNTVREHNDQVSEGYNATISIQRGYFDDNLIVGNVFVGNPRRFVHVAGSARTFRGNIVADNRFTGAIEPLHLENYRDASSAMIALNEFNTSLSEGTLVSVALKNNISISENTVRFSPPSSTETSRVFMAKLTVARHSRFMMIGNRLSGVTVMPESAEGRGNLGNPFIVQGVNSDG